MTTEIKNGSRFYRWAITTLVGALCFILGMVVQGERMNTQVITNTVEIRVLKENMMTINAKLDRLLRDRE